MDNSSAKTQLHHVDKIEWKNNTPAQIIHFFLMFGNILTQNRKTKLLSWNSAEVSHHTTTFLTHPFRNKYIICAISCKFSLATTKITEREENTERNYCRQENRICSSLICNSTFYLTWICLLSYPMFSMLDDFFFLIHKTNFTLFQRVHLLCDQ